MAIAYDYALGGAAIAARHANDAAARVFFEGGLLPAVGEYFRDHGHWMALALLVFALMIRPRPAAPTRPIAH